MAMPRLVTNHLPDFLIIGAQKSGTTSLYDYLTQHPQVYSNPVKETHFFTYMGESHQRGSSPRSKIITDLSEYQALFAAAPKGLIKGEASPSYLYSPKAPQRIKELVPHVKLIAILRNPVDRAYSNYLHARRRGQEPLATFEEALEAEESRVAEGESYMFHYIHKGFYTEQLKRYLALFEPGRLKIYLHEDLTSNVNATLQGLYDYLVVDRDFKADTSLRYNTSGVPRTKWVSTLVRAAKPFRQALAYFLSSGTQQRIQKAIYVPSEPMLSKTRQYLIELYRAEVLALQELLQRDLSRWLR